MLSKPKTLLIILGITAIVCTRVMLVFFDDPEGPNLLVVLGMAFFVFLLSLPVYRLRRLENHQKLILTIITQILIVTVLYFIL